MVHWPEVMVTYDSTDKVLFSADGFGKFGALDVSENWADEARRYYIGIVGKYGAQVQNAAQKGRCAGNRNNLPPARPGAARKSGRNTLESVQHLVFLRGRERRRR